MKKVVITGASGFVGTYLCEQLLKDGYQVSGIGTSKIHPFSRIRDRFCWISADTTRPGDWQKSIETADVVINLAGRNIFRYWTKKYKQLMYDSRILTTRNIVSALDKGKKPVFLSASAVGIYGEKGDEILTEDAGKGDGFLSHICRDWENEAMKAKEKEARVSIMRFGVVMGEGGALAKMLPAFRFCAGGPLAGGQQWFPWIHIRDLGEAVMHILADEQCAGAFNFTAPGNVRHKEFAKTLGRVLNRPAVMPAPGFVIKLIMGELGAALLQSQRAVPQRLLSSGFCFEFPDLENTLTNILRK